MVLAMLLSVGIIKICVPIDVLCVNKLLYRVFVGLFEFLQLRQDECWSPQSIKFCVYALIILLDYVCTG